MSRAARRGRTGGLRAGLALLLLAFVSVSALDFHPAGDAHDELAGGARQVFYPGASHPRAQHHVEPGQSAERPLCPACLNRLQTSGAHHGPPVPLAQLDAGGRAPAPAAAAPLARTLRPRGARAPPLV